MRATILKALRDKYNSEISEAEANLKVYLDNPLGVSEHPNVLKKQSNYQLSGIRWLFERIQ